MSHLSENLPTLLLVLAVILILFTGSRLGRLGDALGACVRNRFRSSRGESRRPDSGDAEADAAQAEASPAAEQKQQHEQPPPGDDAGGRASA